MYLQTVFAPKREAAPCFLSRGKRAAFGLQKQVVKNEQTRSRITGLRAFILQKMKNRGEKPLNRIDKQKKE